MKKLIFFLYVLVLTGTELLAQCNPYFDFKEGDKITHTTYNAKGKPQSSQTMEIKSVKNEGDDQMISAFMTLYDKKDEEVMANEIELTCKEGVFTMDMSRFMPPNLEGMEGISVSFEGDPLELPAELQVGKALDDASFVLNVESSDPGAAAAMSAMMGNTKTTIYNRKVEAKESVTTPAGTFECFKISYTTRMDMSVMGMDRTTEVAGTEWIAEDVGLVRSESYNKKGELEGYTELTKFE